MKTMYLKDAILAMILFFVIGVWFGTVFTAVNVGRRLKLESLQGYSAHATYTTNEIGEVKISEIEWTK